MNKDLYRHYPQQKATVVVDSSEIKRIQQLNDIQCNVEEYRLVVFFKKICFFR